ncbi:MAG: class I SAM-dependent methyltransferase [Deltaproteobacteria bacterium]|nr:class I SAM-dependent methyltransferase [Deltaproteobacteria bacterium]NND28981.1 class I SAM-dependent methyltransferase [Myxococcales bacterium]MBT8463516.1 class I SAM-dependent methyltransferase [Deltaproteobacteria bacterium]MBT8482805.1 class I SAM-dependent methyltransferase [Deltaproteobacteria bacterium]NNK07821.1 class I SAM-dependent methyltransferase [Myxococcales bacterium]
MTLKAILLTALVTALGTGCNGRSAENRTQAPVPGATHEHSTGSEHAFPDPQTYADRLDDPGRDDWQMPEAVVERLACGPGMTVVDLGAGTGYFAGYLSAAVGREGRVLALDIDRSMVDRIEARIDRDELPNVEPGVIGAADPGLAPRSVDRILIVNTWHHISNRLDYADKLRAALRPGGLVLIVDFTIESPHGPPPGMRLTHDTVVRELRAAGFEARLVEAPLPYQYLVAGRLP